MPSRRQFLMFTSPAVLAGCATIPADSTRRKGGVADPSTQTAAWRPEDAAPVAAGPTKAPASADGDRYVCPMHPEVSEPKPGVCPRCGMPLELKKAGGPR